MEYKYFIENEKGEWYYFDLTGNLDMHVNSSNRNYRCQCGKCRGEINLSGWVTNPLEATAYPSKEIVERLLKVLRGEQFINCKITEHEFVSAVTPINTKTNDH
jgi:hypothetical protein